MKKKRKMIKMNRILKIMAIFGIAVFSFVACEDDFIEVGSNIVDNNNFNAKLFDASSLNATSKKLSKVQTNGLSSYALGVYNNPVYGQRRANMLSQLSLRSTDPDFGEGVVLDSVVLSIPYFSTITALTSEETIYKLDSVYGSSPVKLSIYESNYFLRSTDPNDDYKPQAYYSNQTPLFESNLVGEPIITINEFTPSAKEVVYFETNADDEIDTVKVSPRLRTRLPNELFQQKIIDHEGTAELLSNANFQNYFRGLYFKTEALGENGNYTFLDFSIHGNSFNIANDANITLYYHNEDKASTYTLSFGSNIVNTFEGQEDSLPSGGDLYINGGQGSMTVVNLFPEETQLDSIRGLNWLVNEANLTFYVNEDEVEESEKEPLRLFIYDIKNKRTLLDYTYDITANTNNPVLSRQIHLVPLAKDENGNRHYKIRLTEYVNNLINKDSTNTKLGIVTSQNVNISNQLKAEVEGDESISTIPSTAIISPEGTVLYGTNAPDESKELKLNIFYTEPK